MLVRAQVFDRVAREVVLGALQGVNGTVFAYGQTGGISMQPSAATAFNNKSRTSRRMLRQGLARRSR